MSKHRAFWTAGALFAAILGSLLALRSRTPQPLKIGEKATAFSIPALSSGAISLQDYHHDVLVLNFWATWCPPCVLETPSLEEFAERVKPLGVRVLGISVDQDDSALKSFIAAHHITYPIARDPDQRLSARFGTFKFPETYIFDRNGRLAEKIIGATDWDDPRMIQFVRALADWKAAGSTQQAGSTESY